METRAHHVLIGAFTIGVFLLGLAFVLWMSKSRADKKYSEYEIVFNEAVTGLSVGGFVQYSGIKVGEVSELRLAPDDARQVIASVRLDARTPVRQDTRAKLVLQGVTGLVFIQLSGGAPGSPPLQPTPEHVIPQIPSEPSAISRLVTSGSDLVTTANDVLLRVNQLFSPENIRHIDATLQHVDSISGALADERQDVTVMVKQLAETTHRLGQTLTSVNTVADTANMLLLQDTRPALQSMQKAVDKVAASVDTLLADNRSSISHFTNQGLRQLGPTMVELRETLRSIKQLSEKLSTSDGLLLGSDQPKEYQPQ